MKKELYLIEAQNICGFYNQEKDNHLKELPIKIQWAILSAVKQLQPKVQEFEEFRNKLTNDLQQEYFSDESNKCEETQVPQTDENGENVIDDTGAVVMQDARKIKDEFMEEYQAKVNELNAELQNLMIEKTEYEFKGFDLDKVVEGLPDDTKITIDDINMISFLDNGDE